MLNGVNASRTDRRSSLGVPLVLFAALALAVHARLTADLDRTGLDFAVALRPTDWVEAFNWLFRLGYAQTSAALAVAWAVYLFARRRPLPVVLSPLMLLLIVGAQASLRLVVDQPPPRDSYVLHRVFASQQAVLVLDAADMAVRENFVAATTLAGQPNSGTGTFPSGHAARALFLALLGAHEASMMARHGSRALFRAIGHFLVILAALVGLSALYFGYHWPSDVIGGFLLGLVCYQAIAWLRQRCEASSVAPSGTG